MLAACALALMFLSACAGDDDSEVTMPYDSVGEVHAITLWNTSQFSIRELEITPPNGDPSLQQIVVGELSINTHTLVENFISGSTVSFVRDKVEGGIAIEITTQDPVYVDGLGYTLQIWDDDFRLLTPQHSQNPFGHVETISEEDATSMSDASESDTSADDASESDAAASDTSADDASASDTAASDASASDTTPSDASP